KSTAISPVARDAALQACTTSIFLCDFAAFPIRLGYSCAICVLEGGASGEDPVAHAHAGAESAMIRSSLLLAALAVVSVVSGNLAAQTQMPIPPHSTTFSGNVRGYWFTTPVDITIVGVRVPTDATTGPQSVEVVIFDPGVTPPSYSAVTNSFTSAFRQIGVATTTMMATNIQVPAG